MSVATVPARLMTPVFADADWVQDFIFNDDGAAADFTGSTFSMTMAPVSGLAEDAAFTIDTASGYLFEAGGRISLRVPAAQMEDRAALSYQWRLREHRFDDTIAVLAQGVLPINPALEGDPMPGGSPPAGGQAGEMTINRDGLAVEIVRGPAGPIGMPGNYAATDLGRELVQIASPFVGRGILGFPGIRSFEDVSTGLSSAAYAIAIEAMIQTSIDEGGSFMQPPKAYSLAYGLEVEGVPNQIAWGAPSVWLCGEDKPHLTCHVAGGINTRSLGNFRPINTLGTLDNTDTSAIKLVGGDAYVERLIVEKIYSVGCYTTFDNALTSHATAFGTENWLNNCSFRDLWSDYHPDSLNAKYGYRSRRGSGTGNVFAGLKGNIAREGLIDGDDEEALPAHIRIEAELLDVIGDITIDVGQITALDAAVLSLPGYANYLANVRLLNGQVDAQARFPVRWTPMPTNPVYGWVIDLAIGGEIDIGSFMPMMVGSRVANQGADLVAGGSHRQNLPSGPSHILIFRLDVDDQDGC